MTRPEKIEREIAAPEPDELARFRAWFAEFDATRRDSRCEADAEGGRPDALADAALAAHRAGRTGPL